MASRLREASTRYSFLPADSCSQEEEEEGEQGERPPDDSVSLSQFSKEICRDFRFAIFIQNSFV
jgi:hypothetical protein